MEHQGNGGGQATAGELLETRAARVFSFILFVLALISSVYGCYVILRTREPTGQAIADMRMETGTITRLAVGGLWFWSILALAVVSILKEALVKSSSVKLIANGAHFIAVIVMMWLYLLGMFDPLFRLVELLGSG